MLNLYKSLVRPQKMDGDQLERRKRLANIMINRVPEHNNEAGELKKDVDYKFLVETLRIPKEHIDSCYRAGFVKNDKDGKPKPRPLIVKMISRKGQTIGTITAVVSSELLVKTL